MPFWTMVTTIAVWLACFAGWLIFGKRSLGSAPFVYLIFHLVVFVVRPWFVYQGTEQRFLREWIGVWLRPEDHTRALQVANLGLIVFTVGGVIGEALAEKRPAPTSARMLDKRVIQFVGCAFLLLSVLTYVRYSGFQLTSTSNPYAPQNRSVLIDTTAGYASVSASSAYLTNFYNVAIGVLIVWLACFGLRRYIAVAIVLVLLAYALQGYARTFYVTGAFALGLVALKLRGRQWPTAKMTLLGLVLLISFASGKDWAKTAIIDGPSEGVTVAEERLTTYFSPEGETLITYDTFAAVTYLIPRYAPHTDVHLYGRVIYGWVPRAIWQDKPVFDFSSGYIQTQIHRVSFQGLAVSMLGESYMAYGIPSVILFMFLFGVSLGFLVAWCYRYPTASVEFVLGVAICSITPQIYRDGIQSLTGYMLYYFGPCLVMWFVCMLAGRAHKVRLDSVPTGELSPSPTRNPGRVIVGDSGL